VVWVFTEPTPAALAARLDAARLDAAPPIGEQAFGRLLPLRAGGAGEPLFCVHPVTGVAWSFAGLAARLNRPVYGLQSPALQSGSSMPRTIEQWAQLHLEAIRTVSPKGPYRLLGWSLGGVIAHAVAVRLQQQGERVALLALLDSSPDPLGDPDFTGAQIAAGELLGGLLADAGPAGPVSVSELADRLAAAGEPFASLGPDRLARIVAAGVDSLHALARHRPGRYKGELLYFTAAQDDPTGAAGAARWTASVDGLVHNHAVHVSHWGMTGPTALTRIARVLEQFDATCVQTRRE
jgi:thioesterase domain-containing protein